MSKTYSVAEVQQHKAEGNAWIIYKGKVYDVTHFLEQHPGGSEVLLDVAGRDATQDFEDVGHSDEARTMMKDYYIGDLEGSSAKESAKPYASSTATNTSSSNNSTSPSSTAPSSTGASSPPQSSSSILTYILPLGILALAVATYLFLGKN